VIAGGVATALPLRATSKVYVDVRLQFPARSIAHATTRPSRFAAHASGA
jgi:hypothetical protein